MQVREFLRAHVQAGADLVGDSRAVKAGDVFCAVAGAAVTRRDCIADAMARGAGAVLWEEDTGIWNAEWTLPNLAVPGLRGQLGQLAADYYGDPSQRLEVVAITGTKGKTTVANWCAELLRSAGMPTGYVGTLGASSGFNDSLPAGLTTPDPLDLQRLLAGFVAQGCQAVALEVSSHGLSQERLVGLSCDVAVFTNLGSDHLDYHAGKEEYLAAKCRLFERDELSGSVINVDDQHAATVVAASTARVLHCGSSPGCDLQWSAKSVDATGVQVSLAYKGRVIGFHLPVPGVFNASNAALAAGAALLVGVSWQQLAAGLSSLPPVPGRLQQVAVSPVAAYVDYAHTPEALDAVLEALRQAHPNGALICVFGCGGDRDRLKRPQMGRMAQARADHVIVTSDNPREEDPAGIAAEICTGLDNLAHVEVVLERGLAIDRAVARAVAGDVILVAGKGHETSITGAGGTQVEFSDVCRLACALGET